MLETCHVWCYKTFFAITFATLFQSQEVDFYGVTEVSNFSVEAVLKCIKNELKCSGSPKSIQITSPKIVSNTRKIYVVAFWMVEMSCKGMPNTKVIPRTAATYHSIPTWNLNREKIAN